MYGAGRGNFTIDEESMKRSKGESGGNSRLWGWKKDKAILMIFYVINCLILCLDKFTKNKKWFNRI